MEHFYNATSMSNNQVDSQSCKYNSESSFSETNCDDCFQSINCTTNECKSVCNLDLCKNSGDDCSVETNTSIVDL